MRYNLRTYAAFRRGAISIVLLGAPFYHAPPPNVAPSLVDGLARRFRRRRACGRLPRMPALPYVALLVAAALVYLPMLVAARERLRLPEGFDNAHPRAQQARLTGVGQRALGAHANGWEAFAPFAAAVLACEQRHVPDARISLACAVFIASRLFYTAFYLANLPSARSTTWFVGAVAVITLFVFAIRA